MHVCARARVVLSQAFILKTMWTPWRCETCSTLTLVRSRVEYRGISGSGVSSTPDSQSKVNTDDKPLTFCPLVSDLLTSRDRRHITPEASSTLGYKAEHSYYEGIKDSDCVFSPIPIPKLELLGGSEDVDVHLP